MSLTTVHVAYDDTDVALIPADATIILVYIDGRFRNIDAVRARFPHALIITITVTGIAGARFVDCEAGDLTPAQAAHWAANELKAGRKPGIYASVSNMPAVIAALAALGIHRDQVLLWSAHYTGVAHLCGPSSASTESFTTCGFPGMDWLADGCQFTDRAKGVSLDEDLVTNGFLGIKPPPPPPLPHIVKPHGKMLRLVEIDLATGKKSERHIPGTAVWGTEHEEISATLTAVIGGKDAGLVTIK